jgi:hypothetical protein
MSKEKPVTQIELADQLKKNLKKKEPDTVATDIVISNRQLPVLGRSIEEITTAILDHKRQAESHLVEIGKLFIEAQKQLKHGKWLTWLANEVQVSPSTAERYMGIAEQFANSSAITNLGYTKASTLLRLPEGEREPFVKTKHEIEGVEKTVSEMTTREFASAVKQRKNALENEASPAHNATIKSRRGFDRHMNGAQSRIEGILDYIEKQSNGAETYEDLCIALRTLCEDALKRLDSHAL